MAAREFHHLSLERVLLALAAAVALLIQVARQALVVQVAVVLGRLDFRHRLSVELLTQVVVVERALKILPATAALALSSSNTPTSTQQHFPLV
jgi:hypothetical protein